MLLFYNSNKQGNIGESSISESFKNVLQVYMQLSSVMPHIPLDLSYCVCTGHFLGHL